MQRVAYGRWRAVRLLGGKCENCGYNKCVAALDLHHFDRRKKTSKYNVITASMSDGDILKLMKHETVRLVCSNCHREIHAGLHPRFLAQDPRKHGSFKSLVIAESLLTLTFKQLHTLREHPQISEEDEWRIVEAIAIKIAARREERRALRKPRRITPQLSIKNTTIVLTECHPLECPF